MNAGSAPVSSNTGYLSPLTQSSTTGPINSQPAISITGGVMLINRYVLHYASVDSPFPSSFPPFPLKEVPLIGGLLFYIYVCGT